MRNFARDGFAVIPNFFGEKQMLSIKRRAHELIDSHRDEIRTRKSIFSTKAQQKAPTKDEYFMSSGSEIRFFMEENDESAVNKIGHCLHEKDAEFSSFCFQQKNRAICAEIGMTDPRICQTMYILKGPKTGGEVSPHKDNSFLMTNPRLSTIGLWCAVDDATIENGCLFAVPGSHLKDPSAFFRRKPSGVAEWDKNYDPNEFVSLKGIPLEAKSGTLVVLHGNLVHFSAANTSDRSREAFTMHVTDASLQWSPDNWLTLPKEGFRVWQKE